MRAVDVGVSHNHDLVRAQFFEVELVADPRAEYLDQSPGFLRRDDAVEARALDVQNLALQGQDRLHMAVAPLLRRAACRIAPDEAEFAFGGVAFLAVGELAGQARDVHRALAPRPFARLLRGLARRRGRADPDRTSDG